jgi:hypothetical protein
MAASPAKKTTTKTSAKKPAAKKTAVKKPSATKTRKISPEERYKMIEVAAYYIAENNNFQGNAIDFWIAAEEEVSKKLG